LKKSELKRKKENTKKCSYHKTGQLLLKRLNIKRTFVVSGEVIFKIAIQKLYKFYLGN
jgi:hypothetical protein